LGSESNAASVLTCTCMHNCRIVNSSYALSYESLGMNLQHFDWTLVRSFLAVLDAGSLMGAARQLQAQQPTLSRHVAELELQLGTPLFERTGRGVTPTAAALAIADAARQMQTAADQLSRTLTGSREATTGTVRVTASQVAATWLLPPVLLALQKAEPGIAIELVSSNRIENLLRREADIAVRMQRPTQESVVARKLGEVGVGVYAHRSYLAIAGTPRKPEDLLSHRLIGYDRDDTILRGFARMGVSAAKPQFAIRCDDQVAYAHLVAAGAGIGFIGHYHARALAGSGSAGLERVLPQLKIPALPCWLAVHREIRSSKLVRLVYDFLAEVIPKELALDD
jgi:DNA-binding transcriptional LysR family regulator